MHLGTPFTTHLSHQKTIEVESLTLESGYTLCNVPVAYTSRGQLNAKGDNAIVICHALTGSADVGDWWKQMFSFERKALDPEKFFIICMNTLGSPYGTASPMTPIDGDYRHGVYGPDFPATTFADDVRLQKAVLDRLGVKQIAAVVGGSMGGMLALEYAYLGPKYVRSVVPIATTAMQSAWAIGWGENQRHMIYSDARFQDGYYSPDEPPNAGLGAARMSAMLTYRSIPSFSSRFGRNIMKEKRVTMRQTRTAKSVEAIDGKSPKVVLDRVDSAHSFSEVAGIGAKESHEHTETSEVIDDNSSDSSCESPRQRLADFTITQSEKPYYAIQSYLRYQADKFVTRFDANCYIALTEKMDGHDISRYSQLTDDAASESEHLRSALGRITQPTLVMGIESDALYTFEESLTMAKGIPNSMFARIDGDEGHDAFLIHSDQVNMYLLRFFQETLPELMV